MSTATVSHDVILGASFASPGGVGLAGQAYVIYGRGSTITNGSGPISETIDLEPGDQVIYTVSAEIAAGATGETVVNATATVDPSETEDNPNNNADSATTTIQPADSTPPTVTDVIVAGIGGPGPWSDTFINAVDDTGPSGANNNLGFSVVGVTRTIPWLTVNTIYIRYSEAVNAPTALSLLGTSVPDYDGSFTVSHLNDLTTITMTTPFGLPESDLGPVTSGIDRLLLGIAAGGVTDLAGNGLAADFEQPINVLPGSMFGNESVSALDVIQVNIRGTTSVGSGPNGLNFSYDPFFDFNSTGDINTLDVILTNLQGNDALPPASAPLVGGATNDDEESLQLLADQAVGELFG